jgi:hypothetical protein
MESADEDARVDESTFLDAVSRNLRRGRFLLVIVGDGVTENLEWPSFTISMQDFTSA